MVHCSPTTTSTITNYVPISNQNKILTLTKHQSHYESYVAIPISEKKTKQMFLNTTFIAYTVPVEIVTATTTSSNNVNGSSTATTHIAQFMLDTTTSYSYAYCCDSPVLTSRDNSSQLFCVKTTVDACRKVECADKNCYDHFRSTHYPPIVNSLQPVQPPKKKQEDILYESVPYTLEEYRLIHEDFTPEQIGLHNDDQRQQDQQQEKDNSAVLLNTVYADSPLLNYTEGVLGMAFSAFDFSIQQYLTSFKDEIGSVIVGLDLYSEEQRVILKEEMNVNGGDNDAPILLGDGKMILGNALVDYMKNHSTILDKNGIVWSERQYAVNSIIETKYNNPKNRYSQPPIQHQFPIYGLSICLNAIDLFSNYTGNWHAKIASNMVGLGLPTPYYRMMMQWMRDGNNSKPFNQWTMDEKLQLPDLTFTLHQYDSRVLRIPLYTLFEDDQLHLYDLGDIWLLEGIGVLSTEPVIHFGVKVIQQLFTVIDYTNYRVGFVQKKLKSTKEQVRVDRLQEAYCEVTSKIPTCKGDQKFYGPSNTCLQPNCDLYFFQAVNTKTGTCKLRPSFYVLFIFVIGLCLVSEVVLYEVYSRVIRELYGRAASNNAALAGTVN